MIYLACTGLLILFVVAAKLDVRFARNDSVARITPAEHAQLAAFYAERAECYRARAHQQYAFASRLRIVSTSTADRPEFLASHYEGLAAKMQSMQQQHRAASKSRRSSFR